MEKMVDECNYFVCLIKLHQDYLKCTYNRDLNQFYPALPMKESLGSITLRLQQQKRMQHQKFGDLS